ncbi:MAG: hypothetical protein ACRD2S_06310, partial [Terriglobales bacterium]
APLSGGIFSSGGSDLTASATDLTFNFGASDVGYISFFSGSANYDQLCYASIGSGACVPGGIYLFNPDLDGITVTANETGTQVIGTAVPDASGLSLAGITALGMIGAFRKKLMVSPEECPV